MRNGVEVFCVQSVQEQPGRFACTLLLAENEQRRPLLQGFGGVRRERFGAARFAKQKHIARKTAAQTVGVPSLARVVSQVADQAVHERFRSRQASQKRVQEASIT